MMTEPAAHAELISTGAELLNGRTVNRHAQRIGAALAPLGIHLARDTTVCDDLASISCAVREALTRVDTVLVTGGLGPTPDDLTREALADALACELVFDPDCLAQMEARYQRIHRKMTDAQKRQAVVLKGAIALSNPVGIAPGQRMDLPHGKVLFVLPGPPDEMHSILTTHILPWLSAQRAAQLPAERIFMTCGMGESDVHRILEAEGLPGEGVALAYCAAPNRVELRLHGEDAKQLDATATRIDALLEDHIFARKRCSFEEVLAELLARKGLRLACAESCTGGLIGGLLTEVPGSSAWFRGGVIAYANEIKRDVLGVAEELLECHGAVSAEVAGAMAVGARRLLSSDLAVSVTGIAGPGGGTPEKPLGLVYIGIADDKGAETFRYQMRGTRERIRAWTVQRALEQIWRRIR